MFYALPGRIARLSAPVSMAMVRIQNTLIRSVFESEAREFHVEEENFSIKETTASRSLCKIECE